MASVCLKNMDLKLKVSSLLEDIEALKDKEENLK